MVSRRTIDDFLAQRRLAFVGVSSDPKAFSRAVYRELRDRDHELFPVNPHAAEIDGDPCVPAVADLPPVDGAIVMVSADRSAGVVRACVEAGIPRVWLHQGAGPSSVSEEAVALCRDHGVEVVDGACPLMFAEPVAWFHRVHRAGRTLVGGLTS